MLLLHGYFRVQPMVISKHGTILEQAAQFPCLALIRLAVLAYGEKPAWPLSMSAPIPLAGAWRSAWTPAQLQVPMLKSRLVRLLPHLACLTHGHPTLAL